ncbi:uncharacterized protein LOC111316735 isoform X2 [Durio zibethinus]|uniref:Uncharacterized protein LOC111316735 isoform X2 n=1 Tax=Durio zibethinus TaxID=66656 RepID=A0A6P6BBS2_DURZI|nr:uncharacterized protein LOC111316735 isoform X2 [Durio zibethinus]
MIHKRPYIDDSQEVACKHPRQWEDTCYFASVDSDVHPSSGCQNPQIYDKWEDIYTKCQDEGRFSEDQCNNVLSGTNKEYESSASGCVPHFWWVNSNGIDADTEAEVAVHLPLFPEYFASGHQIRAFLHSDEIYSSILSPRKLVSIGPEHQADIPEWSQQDMKSSSDGLDASDPQVAPKSSCASLMVDDDYGKKIMGTCVIPMPDSEATAKFHSEDVGHRIDCECLDKGSIRCIRQHVTEAREKLRDNLGSETFRELGFCDMGEEVAKRWTEEEELAFHSVVLSYPLSLGKNFWHHLPAVLPFHRKKDLVSYYFNVFMLRKRAEQNRVDPVNIDSDDDEWHTVECGISAEDDDSVVESPTDQGTAAHYEHNQEDDCHGDIEDDDEDGVDSSENVADDICRAATDEEDEGNIDVDEVSGAQVESFIGNYGNGDFQLSSKVQGNNEDDCDDIQDDSCTSYEYQTEKLDCCGLPETLMDANQPSQE